MTPKSQFIETNGKGEIVCSSPVMDYMMRPKEYADFCLYDWVSKAQKVKLAKRKSTKPKSKAPKKGKLAFEVDVIDVNMSEAEDTLIDNNDKPIENVDWEVDSDIEMADSLAIDVLVGGGGSTASNDETGDETILGEEEDYGSDTTCANDGSDFDYMPEEDESDSEDDDDDEDREDSDGGNHTTATRSEKGACFLSDHPQHATHQVCMHKSPRIPNLGGRNLPRNDKGNEEDYYMTMLTLFKP